jgi:glutaminase
MSEQLGLHFLNVSRDSRASLRAVYEPCHNVRVYETHGDLLFCGAEQVVRTVDRERKDFDVAILDVSRVDEIDDAARALLAGMAAALRTQGKDGYLVDPDGTVVSTEPELEAVRYRTIEDAVAAARSAVRGGLSG